MTFGNNNFSNYQYENTSGQGSSAFVPPEVAKKFNWGAFFLSWIWGLFNKTYITLIVIVISLVPFIGFLISFIFCIWFGINGNKWAWCNKSFDNINAFHNYQRKWAITGVIFAAATAILTTTLVLPAIFQESLKAQQKLQTETEIEQLKEAISLNKALQKQCKFTSIGLAICFKPRVPAIDRTGNKLRKQDGVIWLFEGKNNCIEKNDCYVKIIVNEEQPDNFISIPLYSDIDGFIYIKDEDINAAMAH